MSNDKANPAEAQRVNFNTTGESVSRHGVRPEYRPHRFEATPRPGTDEVSLAPATIMKAPADWPPEYRSKLAGTEEALKVVRSGQRVYIGGGCGEPVVLAQGLVRRAPELRDVEI